MSNDRLTITALPQDEYITFDRIGFHGRWIQSRNGRWLLAWGAVYDSAKITFSSDGPHGTVILFDGGVEAVRVPRLVRPELVDVCDNGSFAVYELGSTTEFIGPQCQLRVYDRAGALLCRHQFGAAIDQLTLSGDGKYVVALTLGAPDESPHPEDGSSLFLIRLPDGVIQWRHELPIPSPSKIRCDSANDIVTICGALDEEYRYGLSGKFLDADVLVQRRVESMKQDVFGYALRDYAEGLLEDNAIVSASAVEELLALALSKQMSDNAKAGVHRTLGELAEQRGDRETAMSHFRKAIGLKPGIGLKRKLALLEGPGRKSDASSAPRAVSAPLFAGEGMLSVGEYIKTPQAPGAVAALDEDRFVWTPYRSSNPAIVCQAGTRVLWTMKLPGATREILAHHGRVYVLANSNNKGCLSVFNMDGDQLACHILCGVGVRMCPSRTTPHVVVTYTDSTGNNTGAVIVDGPTRSDCPGVHLASRWAHVGHHGSTAWAIGCYDRVVIIDVYGRELCSVSPPLWHLEDRSRTEYVIGLSANGPSIEAQGGQDPAVRDALAVLHLTPPCDLSALKRSYRARLLESHPDHSRDPSATEQTRALINAYNYLMAIVSRKGVVEVSMPHNTYTVVDSVRALVSDAHDGSTLIGCRYGMTYRIQGGRCIPHRALGDMELVHSRLSGSSLIVLDKDRLLGSPVGTQLAKGGWLTGAFHLCVKELQRDAMVVYSPSSSEMLVGPASLSGFQQLKMPRPVRGIAETCAGRLLIASGGVYLVDVCVRDAGTVPQVNSTISSS